MLTHALLQMCAAGKTGPEYLTDFEFVEAITCTYANPTSLLIVGLLVYGAITITLYLTTGGVRIPAVLLLLTGGAVIPQVAAPGVAVAVVALLLIVSALVTVLYYRYSR